MDPGEDASILEPPPALLEYREGGRDDPFREKGWWVAAAAAMSAGLALVQQAVNAVLFAFPDTFTTVSSGLDRNGSTDWLMVATTAASAAISVTMLAAALMYLRGRDTRRALVRVAVVQIVFSLAMSSFVQFRYFRGQSLPDQMIHIVWICGAIVDNALVPALVAVFFHRPKQNLRGADRP